MATIKVKFLEALTIADNARRLTDGESLYGIVRATEKGISVLFRWRYRLNEKLKDYTCGTWPKDSLLAIRGRRDDAEALVKQGLDPNERKRETKLTAQADQAEAIAQQQARIGAADALKARITVRDLFERWHAVVLANRKDGGKEIRRIFDKDVLPRLGALAVEDVKKGHITGVTDALLARGVDRLAKLTFASMRQMFRFAQDRDIIDADPTATIRKAAIGGKAVERDRVLSEAEIRELQQAIPGANLAPATERAIWICLATGCRIGELLQARWQHIDLSAATWRIPEEHSKNQRAHVVFLSAFALDQFRALKDINGAGPWCYPNRDETGPVCLKTITVQLGDRQRPARDPLSKRVAATTALVLTGGRWTPHDLRRTAATLMVMLGALPEVAERCLNHVEENRIKRTYQRHSYEPEMRQAWALLGDRLDLLTRQDAGNVVMLHSKSAA